MACRACDEPVLSLSKHPVESVMRTEEAIFSVLVGLIVGSFLNVCIHRLPKGESLVRPASRCPVCSVPIRWYDNIPVLSFLLLGGRCRGCGGRISWLYPAVEALTGILMCGWSSGFFFVVVSRMFVEPRPVEPTP